MPQVLVPGVAQATIGGLIGVQPWMCVTHWRFGTAPNAWTTQQLQTLVDTLHSGWVANGLIHMPSSDNVSNIQAVDIGASAPNTAGNETIAIGTATAPRAGNASTCTVISCRIAARYRGGHPRIYLPWGTVNDVADESVWTNSYLTNAANSWVAIVNAVVAALPPVGGAAVEHCSIRYNYEYVDDPVHHKYQKLRTSVNNVYTIKSYTTAQVFGTQRRRLVTG